MNSKEKIIKPIRSYMGMTIKEIRDYWEDGRFNIPSYQRSEVWSKDKQQLLIDSIIKGYNVPPLFLIEHNGIYDIVDGQQRVLSIIHFLNGELNLNKYSYPDLYSLSIDELAVKEKKLYEDIITYSIDANVIHNVDDNTARTMFLRQQLGMPLTPGEKIRANYGYARDYVIEISEHPIFKSSKISKNRDNHINLAGLIFLEEAHGDLGKLEIIGAKISNTEKILSKYRTIPVPEITKKRIKITLDCLYKICKKEEYSFTSMGSLISIYCAVSNLIPTIKQPYFNNNFGQFMIEFFETMQIHHQIEGLYDEYTDFYKKQRLMASQEIKSRTEFILKKWNEFSENQGLLNKDIIFK